MFGQDLPFIKEKVAASSLFAYFYPAVECVVFFTEIQIPFAVLVLKVDHS
jgi:hypothetical protein